MISDDISCVVEIRIVYESIVDLHITTFYWTNNCIHSTQHRGGGEGREREREREKL